MANKMVVQRLSGIGCHHFDRKFLIMQLISKEISGGYPILGNNYNDVATHSGN